MITVTDVGTGKSVDGNTINFHNNKWQTCLISMILENSKSRTRISSTARLVTMPTSCIQQCHIPILNNLLKNGEFRKKLAKSWKTWKKLAACTKTWKCWENLQNKWKLLMWKHWVWLSMSMSHFQPNGSCSWYSFNQARKSSVKAVSKSNTNLALLTVT